MFRGDEQAARACAALCDALPRLRGLWAPRPTIDPGELGPCSSGEHAVWAAGPSLWNGARLGADLAELQRLDADNMRRVGSLLVAVADGPAAVERWLAEHERR